MDIQIQHLTKTYGHQKAIDDITCQVKQGEVLGFLGPNGAGKTTIMKIVTGYMAPTGGDVIVDNTSILDDPDSIKQNIGYLPENNPLYEDLPMLDYLSYVAKLQKVPHHKIEERIRTMVVQCGLNEEKHKTIGELSKGYRQRVGLAQAMIHDPEILILDEPTTGLDPNQIVEIRELIKKLGKEKTVILSTHILPEVEASCDRILILDHGKIVADGTPESLSKQKQGEEVLTITIEDGSKDNIYQQLQQLDSVAMVDPVDNGETKFEVQSQPDKSSRKPIFQLCVDNGWALTEMTPHETRLEDIFRELTE